MAEKVLLAGDRVEAAKWVAYARSRLAALKNSGQSYGAFKPKLSILVRVKSVAGIDELYIEAEDKGSGVFLGFPASDAAPDGWGEPYRDEFGVEINPPWGTVGGTNPDAIIHPKKAGWGIKRRVPLEAGNMDWVGKGNQVLTWWGNPSRYFEGAEELDYIAGYGGELFVGSIVVTRDVFGEVNDIRRITKLSPYATTRAYSGDIFRNGEVLVSLPLYVFGASVRKDSKGKSWLQAITAYQNVYGVYKNFFWTAPLDNLSDSTSVELIDYGILDDPNKIVRFIRNTTIWCFNASGTEAQTAYKNKYNPSSGELERIRIKLTVTEDITEENYGRGIPNIVVTDYYDGVPQTTEIVTHEKTYFPSLGWCKSDNWGCWVEPPSGLTMKACTATETWSIGSGHGVIAIDYSGDQEVRLKSYISGNGTVWETRSNMRLLGECEGEPCAAFHRAANYSIGDNRAFAGYLQINDGSMIEHYRVNKTYTKNVEMSCLGVPPTGVLTGEYNDLTTQIYAADIRYGFLLLLRTEYSDSRNNTSCTENEYLYATTYKAEIYINSKLHTTLWTNTEGSSGPASVPWPGICPEYCGDGVLFVSCPSWAGSPREITYPEPSHINYEPSCPLGYAFVENKDVIFGVASIPIGYQWGAAQQWMDSARTFYNKAFKIKGGTVEETDLDVMSEIYGDAPRYLPLRVLSRGSKKLLSQGA